MQNDHRKSDLLGVDTPLLLESGAQLGSYRLAFQMYGEINARRDNVILVCHALTGDQYVASENPVTGRPGWWSDVVGPEKVLDTNRYCVICSNVLGGCMGSEGPLSTKPSSEVEWGVDFPLITIGDMVRAQAQLLDYMGIERLLAVLGGSMGGMQALEWMRLFPERLRGVVAIATSYRQAAQNIGFHEAGRQAIVRDPLWKGGDYRSSGTFPESGLSVARMIAHVTYLSSSVLHEKFGRRLQAKSFRAYDLDAEFQIESYLRHQGEAFTKRFDPNSYLYITRAVDYFDQSTEAAGDLADVYRSAIQGNKPDICLISFSSDWMYPPSESEVIEAALRAAGVPVECHELESIHGHDSFLLKNEEMEGIIRYFLNRIKKGP